jgi:hypothetical protein
MTRSWACGRWTWHGEGDIARRIGSPKNASRGDGMASEIASEGYHEAVGTVISLSVGVALITYSCGAWKPLQTQ